MRAPIFISNTFKCALVNGVVYFQNAVLTAIISFSFLHFFPQHLRRNNRQNGDNDVKLGGFLSQVHFKLQVLSERLLNQIYSQQTFQSQFYLS